MPLSEQQAQAALLSLFPGSTITSGQRSVPKNKLVGGVPDSMHLSGQATDFVAPKGLPFSAIQAALKANNFPATELLNEGDHIHVGWGPKPVKQSQSAPNDPYAQFDALPDAFSAAVKNTGAPKSDPMAAMDNLPDAFSTAMKQPKPMQAASGAAASKAADMPLLAKIGAGTIQGARDVVSSLDPIAQWADQHIGSMTLGGLLPTANEAHANNVAARNAFNQKFGNSTAAASGRALGNIAASVPALALGGELAAPLVAGARAIPYAAPAIDFITGATKSNKLLSLASKATSGAGQGAAAQTLISSASDQPLSDQLKQGAGAGAFLGAAMPLAYDAGKGAVSFFNGGGVNPLRADLAEKAINKFGIPLRGSQISQSPFMNYLDSAVGKLPFSGMEANNEAQRTAFSKAVAGTFGENADNLTPAVMSSARKRIGDVFNTVAGKTTIQNADQILNKFSQIETDAAQALPENELAPIQKQMGAIIDKIDGSNNSISGETYQALTRKGGGLDKALSSSNPNIRYYSGQVRDALDDALEQSASPDDLKALKTARLQWKNMRTVQDLAAKAGIEGEINPAGLLGAVKKSYKDMAYTGAGDIGHLADIGQEFIKPPPSSGTAERMLMYRLLEGTGAGLTGAAALHNPDLVLPAAAGAAGLMGAGRVVGSGLRSDLYRSLMLRAATRQAKSSPVAGAAMNRLLDSIKNFAVPAGVDVRNALMSPSPQAQ